MEKDLTFAAKGSIGQLSPACGTPMSEGEPRGTSGPAETCSINYAMLQILMILSDLLRKYDFQLAPGQLIEARPMIILRPKQIRMTFTNTIAPAPCRASYKTPGWRWDQHKEV